jgi:hypothetical protein
VKSRPEVVEADCAHEYNLTAGKKYYTLLIHDKISENFISQK